MATFGSVQTDIKGVYVSLLDERSSVKDFNVAVDKIGNGVGNDGLERKICHLFPIVSRQVFLKLLNSVFLHGSRFC